MGVAVAIVAERPATLRDARETHAIAVTAIGRPGAMRDVDRPHARWATAGEGGPREEVDRGAGVVEWWRRSGRAATEEGVDLASRPEGDGPLILAMTTGDLRAIGDRGDVATFDARQRARARWTSLVVRDASGARVDARFAVEAGHVSIVVDDARATYPLLVDPLVIGGQRAVLEFPGYDVGRAVAFDGTTALLGAPGSQNGGGLVGVATGFGAMPTVGDAFAPSAVQPNDNFGASVAVSGTTALVGAPLAHGGAGAVYMLQQSGTAWNQTASFTYTGTAMSAQFGSSVALSGTTAVVGAPGAVGGGYVFIYDQTASDWQYTVSYGFTNASTFGAQVAIDGDTIVATDPLDNGGRGAAFVDVRGTSGWTEQARLENPSGAAGDELGASVALQGDTIVLGASWEASLTGAAYVFTRTGTTWTQQARLVASDASPNSSFGFSVALDGDDLVVGAPDTLGHTGAAYSFHRTGTTWTEEAILTPVVREPVTYFGNSVALHAGTVVIGAPNVSVGGIVGRGAAYVFSPASALGDACTADADCASGHCADGVCCGVADCGACGTCASATPGTCGPSPIGATPKTTCGAYACDGSTLGCAVACSGDLDCLVGATCAAATHVCLPGARCSADLTGSYDQTGALTSCGAYLCGSDGTCATTCATSSDCQGGNVCTQVGGASQCVAGSTGSTASGGCAVGPASRSDRSRSTTAISIALAAILAGARRRRLARVAAVSIAVVGSARGARATQVIGAQSGVVTSSSLGYLGEAVAFDGTTIVATSPYVADGGGQMGGALFATQTSSGWSIAAILVGEGAVSGEQAGNSVLVDGATAYVGSLRAHGGDGKVYVFQNGASGWAGTGVLTSPSGASGEYFGGSLAISAGTLVVGAPAAASGAGVVYVLAAAGATATPQAQLSSDGTVQLGDSVAIDGDTLVAGASHTASGAGSAVVFVRSGATWTAQATLTAPSGMAGDGFATGVGVSGDTIVASAPGVAGSTGAAYVFTRSGSAWSLQATLTPPPADTLGLFGNAVALVGDDLVVGAPYAHDAQGVAYSFHRTGTTWTLTDAMVAGDGAPGAQLGTSVALASGVAVVSAYTASPPGAPQSGEVYVFSPASGYGDACTSDSTCASSHCVDGVCCDASACGTCGTCAGATPGTCAPKPLGATSSATCGVYACNGSSLDCPLACAGDAACLDGAHCDDVQHVCTQGAYCSADRTASIDASGASTSCGGYLCGANGACPTACSTSNDCAGGYVCASSGGALGCLGVSASSGGSSGGGCSVGGPIDGGGAAATITLAMLALTRRRRR